MTCNHEACNCQVHAGDSDLRQFCGEKCETMVLRGAYEEDCFCGHPSCGAPVDSATTGHERPGVPGPVAGRI